jgi:hypothetical protein
MVTIYSLYFLNIELASIFVSVNRKKKINLILNKVIFSGVLSLKAYEIAYLEAYSRY